MRNDQRQRRERQAVIEEQLEKAAAARRIAEDQERIKKQEKIVAVKQDLVRSANRGRVLRSLEKQKRREIQERVQSDGKDQNRSERRYRILTQEQRLRDEIKKLKEEKQHKLDRIGHIETSRIEKDSWTAQGIVRNPVSPAKSTNGQQKQQEIKKNAGGPESPSKKNPVKAQQQKQSLPPSINKSPEQPSKDSRLKNPQPDNPGKAKDPKPLSNKTQTQPATKHQTSASNSKPQTNTSFSPAKNISDIYLHKIPLYQRINIKREKNDPLKTLIEEKKQERRELMRRVDIEELKMHSQRVQSAIKMRQEAKERL